MYFCNMLGIETDVVTRKVRRGIHTLGISGYTDNMIKPGAVVLNEGGLSIKDSGLGILEGIEEEPEGNDLIWVLCDKVRFFENVPTYIRYITVDESRFLVCLVEGICGFYDGEVFLTLSRNTVAATKVNCLYKDVNCSDIMHITSVSDKETGYDMVNDVVNAVTVLIKDKKGLTISCKTNRDKLIVFSKEGLLDAKKKHEANERRIKRQKEEVEEAKKRSMEASKLEVMNSGEDLGFGDYCGTSKNVRTSAANAFMEIYKEKVNA